MEKEKTIDINKLEKGWSIEESRKKSKTTGKKRIFIVDSVGACVGASCIRCGSVFEIKVFNKHKNKKFNIASSCKLCVRECVKKWEDDNIKKVKDKAEQWRKNNPEYNKKWRINNPEKVKAKHKKWAENNPEKVKESRKKYRNNNPEKCNAVKHKRRARKKGNGGSYTTEQLNHCISFFDGCCAYTGEVITEGYHIEHIKPIASGGTSYIYNIVPATASANTSKGTKELISWYKEQPYFKEERLNKILQWQVLAYELYNQEPTEATA